MDRLIEDRQSYEERMWNNDEELYNYFVIKYHILEGYKLL